MKYADRSICTLRLCRKFQVSDSRVHRNRHSPLESAPSPEASAMYANNVSNLDQILSSLQCYSVRPSLYLYLSAAEVWRADADTAKLKGARRRVQPAGPDPVTAAQLRQLQCVGCPIRLRRPVLTRGAAAGSAQRRLDEHAAGPGGHHPYLLPRQPVQHPRRVLDRADVPHGPTRVLRAADARYVRGFARRAIGSPHD